MNKLLISTLVLAFSSTGLFAATPVPTEEKPLGTAAKAALQHSVTRANAENRNTFFEGFEDRPDGFGSVYDEWLPDGWQDLSKTGQTVPEYGEARHNLTWRVLNNDNRSSAPTCQNYAYEGQAFAFIMSDVAYGTHTELTKQDEWLVTPAVTPANSDWLYFKLFYSPGWTVYDSKKNAFNARNNQLEVYISTDDGANWTKLWNIIDDEISKNYTEEQLRADLTDVARTDYDPIYINLKDYVGKSIKIAFRYFGSHGQPMAIDNVAVGVPMPKSSYTIPNGFFKQGISEHVDYPANPMLLIPYDYEAVWKNTSEDVLRNEWTYTDATGASVKSDTKDLTTPAYKALGIYNSPILKGFFEDRESAPFQIGYTKMQAGGILKGKDVAGNESEFGVGYYDITDPAHKIVMSSEYISIYPEVDLAWEKVLGKLDGSLDVLGIGNVYLRTDKEYGFDFANIAAFIKNSVQADTKLTLSVYTLDEEGLADKLLGQATLSGDKIPSSANAYVNLAFKFPVAVNIPANTDVLVLLTGFNREKDTIVFPYVKTTSNLYGNSVMYMNANDYENGTGWYETFYGLNSFPLSDGYHFAGLLMTLGASYSWTEIEGDASIEVPAEGGSKTFTVNALNAPEHWAVSEDGTTVADWADFSAVKKGDSYILTLNIKANPAQTARETDLKLVSPGSSATIHVKQSAATGGVEGVDGNSSTKVFGDNGDIVIDGAYGNAEIFNAAGQLIEKTALDGNTRIAASHLTNGIYIVRVNGTKAYKVVK